MKEAMKEALKVVGILALTVLITLAIMLILIVVFYPFIGVILTCLVGLITLSFLVACLLYED